MYWPQFPPTQTDLRESRQSSDEVKPGHTWRSRGNELTDGQISVALNKDLLALIDDITHELAKTGVHGIEAGGNGIPLPPTVREWGRPRISTNSSISGSTVARTQSGNSSMHGSMRGISPAHRAISPARANSPGHRLPKPDLTFVHTSGFPPGLSLFSALPITEESSSPIIRESDRASLSGSPRHLARQQSGQEPLPQVLHLLDDEDDSCIVVVRRITKLGFRSNKLIKQALTSMGLNVKNVVLLPSRSKGAGDSPTAGSSHARPSSMGFVVFGNSRHAQECLERKTLSVEGVEVLVQAFTRQYKATNAATHSLHATS